MATILILHGWGSCAKNWQKVKERLEKNGCKVYLPDLPGFGENPVLSQPWSIDDYVIWVNDFVKKNNLDQFFLLGHSFGGAVAVKLALKEPEKIQKLFLVGAALFRRKAFRKKLFYILAKIFKIFSFLPFYQKIRKAFYIFVVGQSDYPYTEGTMKDTYLKIIKEDLSDILSQLQIPTIIIWGEKDKIVSPNEARQIKEKIRNSKLEILPGIAHSPHQEAPELLVGRILENIK